MSFILTDMAAFCFGVYPTPRTGQVEEYSPPKRRLIKFQDLQNDDLIERSERILEQADKMKFPELQIQCLKNVVQTPAFIEMDVQDTSTFATRLNQLMTDEMRKSQSVARISLAECTKLAEAVKPYHVTKLDSPSVIDPTLRDTILATYDIGEDIPEYISQFDTSPSHTLNTNNYLDVRISRTIAKAIRCFQEYGKNVEIFIGSNKDRTDYYAAKGYSPVAQLNTNNSTKYYVYSSESESQDKLVISGVSNQSRLNNALLRLKFLGANLDNVVIRGTLRSAIKDDVLELEKRLAKCTKGSEPVLAFIGTSWVVLKELYEHLYPGRLALLTDVADQQREVSKMFNKFHKYKKHEGVFEFTSVQVKINGKPSTIVAFIMPNGSLSGVVTKQILNAGFKHLCMVGAGGSIDKESGGGDLSALQIIERSTYHGKDLPLPKETIMPIDFRGVQGIDVRRGGRNISVEGPLEETRDWYQKSKDTGYTSVDVETYHIFDAFVKNKKKDTYILPGIFNSDVVGEHPLEDKISTENAYKNISPMLRHLFKYEKISEAESPVEMTHKAFLEKIKGKHQATREALLRGTRGTIAVLNQYLKSIEPKRSEIVQSFVGTSLDSRLKGMTTLMQLRKEMAIDLFRYVVRPEVELLMRKHGINSSFDEVATVFGFNRLFTREMASAGTDIDYMLAINIKNKKLLQEIQFFIKEIVKPKMNQIGLDIEFANHLIVDHSCYLQQLDNTRNSLFTLANIGNIQPIAGSKEMTHKMFSFKDEQLVEHYANLLDGFQKIIPNLIAFKETLLEKLQSQGKDFRHKLIQRLRTMANSELYIGKNPYKGKKTVQTVFTTDGLNIKLIKRTEKFSIKYCLNRIVDLHAAARIKPSKELTNERLQAIEQLAYVLSNIVCRLDTPKNGHPALRLQKGYADISLEQIQKMTLDDRRIVAQLLDAIGIVIHPKGDNFAEDCYDSLWAVGKAVYEQAQRLENEIFSEALTFVNA